MRRSKKDAIKETQPVLNALATDTEESACTEILQPNDAEKKPLTPTEESAETRNTPSENLVPPKKDEATPTFSSELSESSDLTPPIEPSGGDIHATDSSGHSDDADMKHSTEDGLPSDADITPPTPPQLPTDTGITPTTTHDTAGEPEETTIPEQDSRPTRRKGLKKRLLPAVMLALSVFCMIYGSACAFFAGTGISMLFVWPAGAVFFALCCIWFAGKFPFARLRRKRWLRWLVALSLVALFLLFGVIEGFVIYGMTEKGEPELEYIIVLGAHVKGSTPSAPLRWRIEKAYEYLSENPHTLAVLSGGQGAGEDISEAECMRRELLALGIDESRLLLEDKSTSTAENISLSLKIIGDKDAKIGIVTNNFHVWRALRTARRAGIKDPYGISAPYENILLPHYMVREFFSILFNRVAGNI